MSKVLILNGSPRVNGNTSIAIREMENVFRNSGVEVTTIQIGNKDIRGCIACNQCSKIGKCVFDDIVNELAPLFEAADGLVIASPSPSIWRCTLLSRLSPDIFSSRASSFRIANRCSAFFRIVSSISSESFISVC